MIVNLYLRFDLELFDIAEVGKAEELAGKSNWVLYSWKTTGIYNWLEKGLSIVDVLGIVVLPQGLPDYIDMLDDLVESED